MINNCLNCEYEPDWHKHYMHKDGTITLIGKCKYLYMTCIPICHYVEESLITVYWKKNIFKMPTVWKTQEKIENNCNCWKEK